MEKEFDVTNHSRSETTYPRKYSGILPNIINGIGFGEAYFMTPALCPRACTKITEIPKFARSVVSLAVLADLHLDRFKPLGLAESNNPSIRAIAPTDRGDQSFDLYYSTT